MTPLDDEFRYVVLSNIDLAKIFDWGCPRPQDGLNEIAGLDS